MRVVMRVVKTWNLRRHLNLLPALLVWSWLGTSCSPESSNHGDTVISDDDDPRLSASENAESYRVTRISAHNSIEDGRRVVIRFGRYVPLRTMPPEEFCKKWIQIEPPPAELSWRLYGSTVEARGAFALRTDYRVTVRPGWFGTGGLHRGEGLTNTIRMRPLAPRFYLPALETTQLSGGSRGFPIRAVNVHKARVRAHKIEPQNAFGVMHLHESSFRNLRNDFGREPYQRIELLSEGGRLVLDETIQFEPDEDAIQEMSLEWDKILGAGESGLVCLDIEELDTDPSVEFCERVGAQALVQVTDLGLTWKQGLEDLLVHVFSHETGQPVAGAEIQLGDVEGLPLAHGLTDTQGLVHLSLPATACRIQATYRKDTHAADLHDHRLSLYQFNVPYTSWWEPEIDSEPRCFVFADRHTYRPGEIVHCKAMLRRARPTGLDFAPLHEATWLLADPRGDEILRTNLTWNEFGSADYSFPLPIAKRGQYQLSIASTNGLLASLAFQVEDVQTPAFNLDLQSAPQLSPEDPIQIHLSAHYWMGAPVSRGQVRWTAEARDSGFEPQGFEAFIFASRDIDEGLGRNESSYADQGQMLYQSGSPCMFEPNLPFNQAAPQPQRVSVRATLTDLNQQTIPQSTSFARHSSDFYLGMSRMDRVLTAGKPLAWTLIAVGADGRPWPRTVTANLTCYRRAYQTRRMQGAGGSSRFESELTLSNVMQIRCGTAPVVPFGKEWMPEPGATQTSLVLTEPGYYLLEASTTDDHGRPVVTAQSIYVTGPEDPGWANAGDQRIELVTDQSRYRVGDTAKILVKTPVTGSALLTVERESIRQSKLIRLQDNCPILEIALTAEDAPNVFVSVLLVRGRGDSGRRHPMPTFRMGYCELKVDNPATQLLVSLLPQRASYRPGQEVEVAATVTDASHRPVPNAELTVYAVDEGMLQFLGEDVPDPHAYFHAARLLQVRSHITLPWLFPEDPSQRRFFNKGYIGGGGGKSRVRSQFEPCAFWQTGMLSDADGRVIARFTAPDNLTQYRLIAVAQTKDHRFGSGREFIRVNQPIMVEPSLPRFAHVQDLLTARALVHNQTSEDGTFELTLQLDQTATTGQTNEDGLITRRLHVPARSVEAVDIPVRFVNTGQARWTWTARKLSDATSSVSAALVGETTATEKNTDTPSRHQCGEDWDATVSTMEVSSILPLVRRLRTFEVAHGETNLLEWLRSDSVEGEAKVKLRLARTQLIGVAEAARQLLHYPYGCVEQTSSSLLPWLTLQETTLQKELGLSALAIATNVAAGVNRLFSMQTSSGGLSYWPGAESPMGWGSAYAAAVLAQAEHSGYEVPKHAFAQLQDYLIHNLAGAGAGRSLENERAPCLTLYALALAWRPQHAYQEVLFGRRHELSREDRDLLALAILHSKAPRSMATELLKNNAFSPGISDPFGGLERSDAIRLLALIREGTDHENILAQTGRLIEQQREGHWRTTQGNAWSLLALGDYARLFEPTRDAISGSLLGFGPPQPFEVSTDRPMFETSLLKEAGMPWPNLRVFNPSHQSLFATVDVSNSCQAPPNELDHGFKLTREYLALDDLNQTHRLKSLKVGDRVLVILRVWTDRSARYVVVDDPLPAVLEGIHASFEPSASAELRPQQHSWADDFHELRNDRALFFKNHLVPGEHRIQYVARTRAAGEVTAPPAKIEAMYDPSRYGLTAPARVVAKGWQE